MDIFNYEEQNFKEVLKRLHKSQDQFKEGGGGRMLFNESLSRFEYYPPGEEIPDTYVYEHAKVAIERYLAKRIEMETALGQTVNATSEPGDEVHEVNEDGDGFIDNDETFDGTDQVEDMEQEPPFDLDVMADTDPNETEETITDAGPFENEDREVYEATTKNLEAINAIRMKLDAENKKKLADIIGGLYKTDIVSESDVALALVERDEYRKILSLLLGLLNVTVSTTKVSMTNLEVSSGKLTFVPHIDYSLEDYRRGIAQCLVDIKRMAEDKNKIKENEDKIQELNTAIASERRQTVDLKQKIETLEKQKAPVRELKPIAPIKYTISYLSSNGVPRFIAVKPDAQATEDGSFPLKFVQKVNSFERAYQFDNASALAQIRKMIKHKENVRFADLKDKGSKELMAFFTLNRIVVEKVESINL